MNYSINKQIEYKDGKKKITTCDNYDPQKCKECIDGKICKVKSFSKTKYILIFLLSLLILTIFVYFNFHLSKLHY